MKNTILAIILYGFLAFIILLSSCQKGLDWTLKEANCVPPTFLQNGTIIGHIHDENPNGGALYIFPKTGVKPFKVSINGGITYLKDVCDPNGNFSIVNLTAGHYSICIKDNNGCISNKYEVDLEVRR